MRPKFALPAINVILLDRKALLSFPKGTASSFFRCCSSIGIYRPVFPSGAGAGAGSTPSNAAAGKPTLLALPVALKALPATSQAHLLRFLPLIVNTMNAFRSECILDRTYSIFKLLHFYQWPRNFQISVTMAEV